jgi:hypothetical protein
LALPWSLLDIEVEQLSAVVERLPLNEVYTKLQTVITEVLKGIGLLLLKVVYDLSETLFGRALQGLRKLNFLIEGYIALGVIAEVVLFIFIKAP